MGQQLTIFDCSTVLRQQDELYLQLYQLAIGQECIISDIIVLRTERFYVVSKPGAYEEVIADIQRCYAFVNTQLAKETGEENNNARDKT